MKFNANQRLTAYANNVKGAFEEVCNQLRNAKLNNSETAEELHLIEKP